MDSIEGSGRKKEEWSTAEILASVSNHCLLVILSGWGMMDIQISSLEDPLWQRQHSFEHFQRQSGDAKHAIDGPKIFLVSLFYDSSMHVSKGFLIIFMLLLPPFMPPSLCHWKSIVSTKSSLHLHIFCVHTNARICRGQRGCLIPGASVTDNFEILMWAPWTKLRSSATAA